MVILKLLVAVVGIVILSVAVSSIVLVIRLVKVLLSDIQQRDPQQMVELLTQIR